MKILLVRMRKSELSLSSPSKEDAANVESLGTRVLTADPMASRIKETRTRQRLGRVEPEVESFKESVTTVGRLGIVRLTAGRNMESLRPMKSRVTKLLRSQMRMRWL